MTPEPKIKPSDQCIMAVGEPPGYWHWHRCTRRAGFGPGGRYCRQHGKVKDKQIARRVEVREAPEREAEHG
jgi:hypothetical protein